MACHGQQVLGPVGNAVQGPQVDAHLQHAVQLLADALALFGLDARCLFHHHIGVHHDEAAVSVIDKALITGQPGKKAASINRTIGWQLGGQSFSQLIFFEDQRAYEDFTSGNFEFGAQASAVAITAGANATASTAGGASAGTGKSQAKTAYSNGMAIFTRAKGGLMYEATVSGQKFTYDSF